MLDRVRRAALLLLGGLGALACAQSRGAPSELGAQAPHAPTPPLANLAASAPPAQPIADAAALAALSAAPASDASAPAAPAAPLAVSAPLTASALNQLSGGPGSVRAEHGAVSSVEARATRAGVTLLEHGGNAVDAAVAVAYALAVTHPNAGNLGGGGFMLIRPKGGPTFALDFRETAPLLLTRAAFDAMEKSGGEGPVAVGVPGSVAGLELAHDRFGRLPRAEVLRPAIELAKSHPLGAHQAALLAANFRALKRDLAARAIFGKGKQPLAAGDRLEQKDLAATLQRISDFGRDGFYAGVTARALSSLAGGLIRPADLSSYEAKWREPLRVAYRGLEVEVMPPPSAGGVAVAEILLMLQALHAETLAHDSAAELHLFLEASRRAQAERRFGVIDPDALTPAQAAQKRARWLDPDTWLKDSPIDPEHATPSANVHPLYESALRELEHTTHFSVVDQDGMVVSCTTTLSASFGAKIVAPGTGVVLNNSVASFASAGDNQPLGGRRTISSMAPTLVLAGQEPLLVLGSPGGDTIPSTVVQVLRHVLDHGETLAAAVDAPRVHHGFVPDEVRYEPRNAPPLAVRNELVKRGHRLKKGRAAIGDANEILIRGGVAWAYADPREGGSALAAKAPSAR
jgi:gamma-glutamyltranspeptidase/glutathione hydrolase